MPTAREEKVGLESIIESAMDAIITVDEDLRIVLYNRAAADLFGVAKAQAMGSPLDRFVPPHPGDSRDAYIKRFSETGQPGDAARRIGGRSIYGVRAGGEQFPIDASFSQSTVVGRKLYTVILRDVTEQVHAEEALTRAHAELAALSRAANQALEDERRRIARELHDELGQMLTAMKIDVTDLQQQLPTHYVELHERCEGLRLLIDQTITATRHMSTELRPLVLDDLGLAAAVDWLAENFSRRTGMRTTVRFDPAVAHMGEPHASSAFRIVQESLTNIMRHAEATHVEIEVTHHADFACVIVRDDGRGIRPEDFDKPGSLGLLGIRERVRLLGGVATIAARPEGGTQLSARFPLAQHANAAHPA